MKVPEGYKGVIVKEAANEDDVARDARRQSQQDEEDNQEGEDEITELHDIGSFDEVMLWGHESIVEEDDTFAKGTGEWIKFAESVSSIACPGIRSEAVTD